MAANAMDGGPSPELLRRNSSTVDLSRAAQKLLLRVSICLHNDRLLSHIKVTANLRTLNLQTKFRTTKRN